MNSYLALTQKSWQAAQYTTTNLLSPALAPVHSPTQLSKLILLSAAHAPKPQSSAEPHPWRLITSLDHEQACSGSFIQIQESYRKILSQINFFSLQHLNEYMRMVLVVWQFSKAMQQ